MINGDLHNTSIMITNIDIEQSPRIFFILCIGCELIGTALEQLEEGQTSKDLYFKELLKKAQYNSPSRLVIITLPISQYTTY